eukprot:5580041-Alexandrium_andersonii.AAC.1
MVLRMGFTVVEATLVWTPLLARAVLVLVLFVGVLRTCPTLRGSSRMKRTAARSGGPSGLSKQVCRALKSRRPTWLGSAIYLSFPSRSAP